MNLGNIQLFWHSTEVTPEQKPVEYKKEWNWIIFIINL